MKKICVQVGRRRTTPKCIWAEDISKLYYFKKRSTPRLPKFTEELSDFEESRNDKFLV